MHVDATVPVELESAPRACLACGSVRLGRGFSVRGRRFERCGACKTLVLLQPPPIDELASYYEDASYFVNPTFDQPEIGGYYGYKDYLADRAHIEAKFGEVLERVERHVKPGRMLDVGAGPGFLLSAAKHRGWTGTGIDLNPWAVQYAREVVGVDVELASAADAPVEPASLDLVAMMDVIEHVVDPGSLVDCAAELLVPGGVLVVLTADAGSWVSRLLGRRWPEARRAPEHVVLLSVTGLSRMLERSGFEILGWHSVGKTSTIETLLSDIGPVAPRLMRGVRRIVAHGRLAQRTFELDPHTKFCLYARRIDPSPPS
jgi:SAM-dependent methyltransferase